MKKLSYTPLNNVSLPDLMRLLNKARVREHLMAHSVFDLNSTQAWINSKMQVDETEGCIVRAVLIEGALAGWCGIQLERNQPELAIVLDDQYWGAGKQIFRDMSLWARDLGHSKVYIHLLDTRRSYRFLTKIAERVYPSKLYGHQFMTYEISVDLQLS